MMMKLRLREVNIQGWGVGSVAGKAKGLEAADSSSLCSVALGKSLYLSGPRFFHLIEIMTSYITYPGGVEGSNSKVLLKANYKLWHPSEKVNIINLSKFMQQVSAGTRFLTPEVLSIRPCFLPVSHWSLHRCCWLAGGMVRWAMCHSSKHQDCTTVAPAGDLSLFLYHIHGIRISQRKQSSETRAIPAMPDSPVSSLLLAKRTEGQAGGRFNENGSQHIRDCGTRTESEKVGRILDPHSNKDMCFL